MKKTLAKRALDEITFLPHSIEISNTISKTSDLDEVKDLMELLIEGKPHRLHAQHMNDTLTVLDKLHGVFEPPTQIDEIAASSIPDQITREPHHPIVPIKKIGNVRICKLRSKI